MSRVERSNEKYNRAQAKRIYSKEIDHSRVETTNEQGNAMQSSDRRPAPSHPPSGGSSGAVSNEIDPRLAEMWERCIRQAARDAGIGHNELKTKLAAGEASLEIKAIIPATRPSRD
jgi:hypothetical protein